jgi:hypothetical protein
MKTYLALTPQVICPKSISHAPIHLQAFAGSLWKQRALCTQAPTDLVLSHLLEITRNTTQKECFVSLRILKEAFKDLKRNDLNKRTKKET